jgi:hypothetical protein
MSLRGRRRVNGMSYALGGADPHHRPSRLTRKFCSNQVRKSKKGLFGNLCANRVPTWRIEYNTISTTEHSIPSPPTYNLGHSARQASLLSPPQLLRSPTLYPPRIRILRPRAASPPQPSRKHLAPGFQRGPQVRKENFCGPKSSKAFFSDKRLGISSSSLLHSPPPCLTYPAATYFSPFMHIVPSAF